MTENNYILPSAPQILSSDDKTLNITNSRCVFYGYVKSHHKFSSLKHYTTFSYLTVFECQESEHSLAESSARLQSKC